MRLIPIVPFSLVSYAAGAARVAALALRLDDRGRLPADHRAPVYFGTRLEGLSLTDPLVLGSAAALLALLLGGPLDHAARRARRGGLRGTTVRLHAEAEDGRGAVDFNCCARIAYAWMTRITERVTKTMARNPVPPATTGLCDKHAGEGDSVETITGCSVTSLYDEEELPEWKGRARVALATCGIMARNISGSSPWDPAEKPGAWRSGKNSH